MRKLTTKELRNLFIEFFKTKDHAVISSASLIPENDPSVLFTTAGMHPLVPYLLGEKHPAGKRLVNVQKCVRTGDIDDVGDTSHLTFFEMLGNWSLGDYFKKEAIEYSYEFLTSPDWLGIDKDKLYFTVFAGDEDAPKDVETMSTGLEWALTFAYILSSQRYGGLRALPVHAVLMRYSMIRALSPAAPIAALPAHAASI